MHVIECYFVFTCNFMYWIAYIKWLMGGMTLALLNMGLQGQNQQIFLHIVTGELVESKYLPIHMMEKNIYVYVILASNLSIVGGLSRQLEWVPAINLDCCCICLLNHTYCTSTTIFHFNMKYKTFKKFFPSLTLYFPRFSKVTMRHLLVNTSIYHAVFIDRPWQKRSITFCVRHLSYLVSAP